MIEKLNSDKMLRKYILKLNVQISATLEFYRYLINAVILNARNFLLHKRHMFTSICEIPPPILKITQVHKYA